MFTPTIYRISDADITRHRGEVRLFAQEYETDAYESRIPFKMFRSPHLTPAKE